MHLRALGSVLLDLLVLAHDLSVQLQGMLLCLLQLKSQGITVLQASP